MADDKTKIRAAEPKEPQTGLYKTVYTVTVLSDKQVYGLGLRDLAFEIVEGESSGKVDVAEPQQLTKRQMALELLAQDSDPGYLLGEDGWKYALEPGDEVTWKDPDGGLCTKTITIQTIEYIDDDTVRITDKDGGELEARIEELS